MRALAVAVVLLCSTARAQVQPAVLPAEPAAEAAPARPALSEPPPPPQVVWPKPGEAVVETKAAALEGVHGYVGISAGLGVALFQGFSFPLALRGGVWLGKLDLSLEVAPLSDFILQTTYFDRLATVFQVSAGAGYLVPLVEKGDFAVGWPFRVNAGLFWYYAPGARLSLNLLGVGFRFGKLHLELTVPATFYVARGQALVISLPLTLSFSLLF
jgi:hypothetical protein